MASEQTSPAGATPAEPDPAAGAMPGGQQQPPEGATPPAGSSAQEGARPDTSLGDAGREALDKERAARREADRQLAEARKRVAQLEDAGKSENDRRAAELERAQDRIRELEGDQQQRQLADLKREVAEELQLPASLAPRLQGDDRRALRADATKLAEELRAGRPEGDLGIGRGGAATGQPGRVDMTQLIREAAGRG